VKSRRIVLTALTVGCWRAVAAAVKVAVWPRLRLIGRLVVMLAVVGELFPSGGVGAVASWDRRYLVPTFYTLCDKAS